MTERTSILCFVISCLLGLVALALWAWAVQQGLHAGEWWQ